MELVPSSFLFPTKHLPSGASAGYPWDGMEIEDVLEAYPKKAKLKGGGEVALRPLQPKDAKLLHEFFCALPELERVLIKHRVTDLEVIRGWCKNIDYSRNLPMLALIGGKVVADGRLHRDLGGWKRHIGRVSIAVHPQHRGKGLARHIVSELMEIARMTGLERLEAEFLAEQEGALKLFGALGFRMLLKLRGYVKDMQALEHDYILMGINLKTPEELTHAAG